jgi:hypothetical protein
LSYDIRDDPVRHANFRLGISTGELMPMRSASPSCVISKPRTSLDAATPRKWVVGVVAELVFVFAALQ